MEKRTSGKREERVEEVRVARKDLARDAVSEMIETVCKSLLPCLLSSAAETGSIGGVRAKCGTKFNCGTFSCTKDVACTSAKFRCTEFSIIEMAPGDRNI